MKPRTHLGEMLLKCESIIWDESIIADKMNLECLNRCLKDFIAMTYAFCLDMLICYISPPFCLEVIYDKYYLSLFIEEDLILSQQLLRKVLYGQS